MSDKVEIQETISRYHDAASRSDWDQLLATFLSDGTWEVPALDVRCVGHAEMRSTMPALVASIEYLVQINAPAIITLDGDSASATSLIRECAKLQGRPTLMDVVGQFSDELRRTDDGWRFADRTFTIIGTFVTEGRG